MTKKRIISSLLAAVLLISLTPAALAATPTVDDAAQALAALDIMVGDQDGDLNLDGTVTRAEFTKLAVAASPMRESVGDTVSVKPYPDVPQTHWAAPFVKAAVDLGLVQGDLRGNFNPGRSITLAEGVTIVLRLLGYEDSEFTGMWPSGQMAQYRALDLDRGVSCGANDPMKRRDALFLFYNLLLTKNKSGQYYLNVLEPTLNLVNTAGELDQVALVNSAMEGPVIAAKGWQSQVPFPLSNAKVYRAGSPASLDAIQDQDVVYWSKSMRSIWAYSRKVTGTLEQLAPSASNPTSVTVAGKSYAIETTTAAFALSDLGAYKVGDSITLLLGRNEGVAAVTEPNSSPALISGVVARVADMPYDDGAGGAYNAQTVTIFATDGNTYNYPYDDKYIQEGNVVRVEMKDGNVKLRGLTSTKISGRVNAAGTALGSYPLAEDIEIIDIYESCTPLRVYPSRLAGANLSKDMIRFYALNTHGEISHLILNDVTGDLHQYGVITGVTEVSAGLNTMSNYVYDINGQPGVASSDTTIYNLKVGPCQVKMEGPQTVERLYNLSELKVESILDNQVLTKDDRKYTISDNVVVYIQNRDQSYTLSSLARVLEGEYTLTAWYDKPINEGGRVRVIIAR